MSSDVVYCKAVVTVASNCDVGLMECMCVSLFFFVFKQKAAYDMRISDWSSDVCSSDLRGRPLVLAAAGRPRRLRVDAGDVVAGVEGRKSVVEGESVSVRVDLGGRRTIPHKQDTTRLGWSSYTTQHAHRSHRRRVSQPG